MDIYNIVYLIVAAFIAAVTAGVIFYLYRRAAIERAALEESQARALESFRRDRLERYTLQAQAQAVAIESSRRRDIERAARRAEEKPSTLRASEYQKQRGTLARSLASPPRGTNGGYRRPPEVEQPSTASHDTTLSLTNSVHIASLMSGPVADYTPSSFDAGSSCSVDTSSSSVDCSSF